jgi:hypothetical protein
MMTSNASAKCIMPDCASFQPSMTCMALEIFTVVKDTRKKKENTLAKASTIPMLDPGLSPQPVYLWHGSNLIVLSINSNIYSSIYTPECLQNKRLIVVSSVPVHISDWSHPRSLTNTNQWPKITHLIHTGDIY